MSTLVTAILAGTAIADPIAKAQPRPMPEIRPQPRTSGSGVKAPTSRLLTPVLPQGARVLRLAQR